MTIKMIASDMDGTFLNERGVYDRSRFETILQELQKRDIRFVAASGNNMARLNLIFDGLSDQLTFVAENGAHLVEQGQTLIRHSLASSDFQEFLDYFGEKLAPYRAIVSGERSSYILKTATLDITPGMITAKEKETFLAHIKQVDDFLEIPVQERISKITMMLLDADYQKIMTEFNQHFTGNLVAVSSGYGALDFIQGGIHKAWGLKVLMKRYGIDQEELMTFGDGGNDIEMLALTKHSYAVANASEQVKKVAHHLAPSHRNNGVLEIIESYLS